MHDATEQKQGEIRPDWSQGHQALALWQRSFPYTKGRSFSKGLILKTVLQKWLPALLSLCAGLPQNGNTKVVKSTTAASLQLFSSWILEVPNAGGGF